MERRRFLAILGAGIASGAVIGKISTEKGSLRFLSEDIKSSIDLEDPSTWPDDVFVTDEEYERRKGMYPAEEEPYEPDIDPWPLRVNDLILTDGGENTYMVVEVQGDPITGKAQQARCLHLQEDKEMYITPDTKGVLRFSNVNTLGDV